MAELIVFNEEYQIFICRQHQYAVTNVATHLYEEHKELSKDERKTIAARYKDQRAVTWSDLRTPPPYAPPIAGLKPPIVAFLCSPASGYMTGNTILADGGQGYIQ